MRELYLRAHDREVVAAIDMALRYLECRKIAWDWVSSAWGGGFVCGIAAALAGIAVWVTR
jgi:hypothetical protein